MQLKKRLFTKVMTAGGQELRLITELFRNRPDRYQPLIQFMQWHGCDLDYIRRGIAAAGLSQTMQDDVLNKLREAPVQGRSRSRP